MKRWIATLLAIAMTFCLASCGGKDSSSVQGENAPVPGETDSPQAEKSLVLGETASVTEYADFTLVSIETTNKVTASMSADNYYENSEAGHTYIDVVFDVTNTSPEELDSETLMEASATDESGTVYPCKLYVVEKEDMTWVSNYAKIAPLASVRFHAAISVPDSGNKFSLDFDWNGSRYIYDYTMNTAVKNTVTLNAGDVIGDEEYATLEFVGAKFADRLDPSNTSSFYSYMEVKNSDSTYLILEFKLTNYQANEKDVDSFIGASATFMDKYKYSGSTFSEDSDQKGISAYNDVSPLETVRAFVLIEVPKSVADKEYSATVCFNKQFYTVNG